MLTFIQEVTMQNVKDPYFILSLLFGALGVYFWGALIPFLCLLSVHVFTKHIKNNNKEVAVSNLIIARIEHLEKMLSFKR